MNKINFRGNNKQAQSTLEFAVLVVCVVAGLIAMQIYMKRGISGRLRQASDDIGPQYEPLNTTADMTTSISRDVTGTFRTDTVKDPDTGKDKNVYTKTETINSETTKEWGNETVGPMQ